MSLDIIRTGSGYDLASLYQDTEDDITDKDSPFQYAQLCDYYEPKQFNSVLDTMRSDSHTVSSCLHLNCRGLATNWDEFHNLLCETQHEFDFIGISECFKTNDDPRLQLQGYHNLLSRCRDHSPRGGVALFVKDHINFKIREDLSVFLPHIFESLFIEIFQQSSRNIIVGVIYRPNTEPLCDINVFETTLYELINIINKEEKRCTILGDMNIDLLKFDSHSKTNNYLENIFASGFLPMIHKPTRVTHSSATLIDHIYTNDISNSAQSGIIITDVADHFATFLICKCKRTKLQPKTIKIRQFSEENITKFKNKLDSTDFNPVFQLACPDEAYSEFIKLYLHSFNEAFPLREITTHSRNIKHEPWYTPELSSSFKAKSELYSKKLSKPSELNINAYRDQNRKYNKLKREMKFNYYRNILQENKHDIKKTWMIMKQALGKLNDKSSYPSSFLINNVTVTDKQQIADMFNNFFSNIGRQTNHNVPKSKKSFSSYLPNPIPNSIFLETVSPPDVLKAACKLKPKSSFGHDNISSKLLKDTIINVIEPFTHIINRSIDTGIVPKLMKIAKVIPIHKASDQTLLKNYRPISLLPVFSKLLERLMYNKVTSFLNSNDLLYKHQYGFREKHSTIHPIVHLLNHCAKNNNKSNPETTLATFCDLSKAFDVISHDILLKKLDRYGIRGIANQWFGSYLSERVQYVDFDGHTSMSVNIDCGVPQGSILGPLLYLIYVNDIHKACEGQILSFADDTTAFTSHSELDILFQTANIQINKLFEWFCSNRLSLNASKTKYIVIRPKHIRDSLLERNIYIGDTKLSRIGNDCTEKSVKFLGILIDENLTWNDHVSHVNKKISRALFSINQTKNILPKDCLRSLYFSLVHSHLSYGLIAWGNTTQGIMHQTNILQKRAIRIVNGAKYNSHTDPLFRASFILKLNDMFEYQLLLFMFDFKAGILPLSFVGMFTLNKQLPNARLTRQSELYYVPRCRSRFASKLPLFTLPEIWNKWALHIPANISRYQLKKYIRTRMIEEYQLHVTCRNPWCKDCNG